MRILNTSPGQNLDKLRMATIQICMNKPFFHNFQPLINRKRASKREATRGKKKQINVWKSSNLLHKNKQRLHLMWRKKKRSSNRQQSEIHTPNMYQAMKLFFYKTGEEVIIKVILCDMNFFAQFHLSSPFRSNLLVFHAEYEWNVRINVQLCDKIVNIIWFII